MIIVEAQSLFGNIKGDKDNNRAGIQVTTFIAEALLPEEVRTI